MTEQVDPEIERLLSAESVTGPRWIVARYGQFRMAIHATWVFAAVGLVIGSGIWDWANGSDGLAWQAGILAWCLLACGLIDELAHYIAARSVGGRKPLLLIGPLGGLGAVFVPPGLPRIATALAGPLALIAIGLLLGALSGNPAWFLQPALGSIALESWNTTGWRGWALGGAWMFVGVALLQLIPLRFSDGAAALLGLFELATPRSMAPSRAWRARLVCAGAVVVVGFWMTVAQRTFPWAWMWTLASVVLAAGMVGPEIAQPGRARRAHAAKPRTRWFGTYRVRRAHRREVREAVESARLDEVLDRLHQFGAQHLSRRDRAVLQRASKRLRQSTNKGERLTADGRPAD
jgi:hypothetical protein